MHLGRWYVGLLGVAIFACNADQFSTDAGSDGQGSDVIISGGDGAPGEGGCGDTQSSSQNCGVCGHSCLGSTCQAGVCQPALFASLSHAILSLAADDTNVYLGAEIVYACAKGGCSKTPVPVSANYFPNVTNSGNVLSIGTTTRQGAPWIIYANYGTLAAGGGGYLGACAVANCTDGGTQLGGHFYDMVKATNIAVTPSNSYGASATLVEAFPTAGGSTSTFTSSGGTITSIAADNANNFLYSDVTTGVYSCLQSNCSSSTQLFATSANAIKAPAETVALHANTAYWLNLVGLLESCSVTTCNGAVNPLYTSALGRGADLVITSNGTAYFSINYTTGTFPVGDPNSGVLYTCDVGNCATPKVLAKTRNFPWRIVVTNNAIYWTEGTLIDNLPNPGPYNVYQLAL